MKEEKEHLQQQKKNSGTIKDCDSYFLQELMNHKRINCMLYNSTKRH